MEQISILMDDEASDQEARQALLRLGDNPAAREAWQTYHLIGDALRSQSAALDVGARVSAALENEPTVLAPRRATKSGKPYAIAWSAAASISAIAVVGWLAFSADSLIQPKVDLARKSPTASELPPVSAPIDGQMNDYLLAHQGVSPSTGLQGVAPYVRTIATVPVPGR